MEEAKDDDEPKTKVKVLKRPAAKAMLIKSFE